MFPNAIWCIPFMLNAHLPTGSRQLAISPTADWESVFVGRCVPNAHPIVGANRRYSADSKFESALEPVGRCVPNADPFVGANRQVCIDF